jgi:long-subunit acyl-CoA synthetase (AMP-forming)
MAHSTRQNDIRFLVTGGRIGLISELKNLFEDCQLLNPSMTSGVPRVWNKLYSEFNEALSKATEGQPKEVRNPCRISLFGQRNSAALQFIAKCLFFDGCCSSPLTRLEISQKYRQIERHVLQQFGKLLGNRLDMISVGGAPPSKAILNFLRRCFRCIVVDGYGITGISIYGQS